MLALVRRELADIAHGLYPSTLVDEGLAGALADATARTSADVTLDLRVDDAAIPPPIGLAAYYVASEALTNVTKHAQATHARLELFADRNRLVLRVSDDGVGGADPAGAGLSGLRERVEAAQGDLEVQSPPGTGTVVEARFPLG